MTSEVLKRGYGNLILIITGAIRITPALHETQNVIISLKRLFVDTIKYDKYQ
jgi:hypothetical protein